MAIKPVNSSMISMADYNESTQTLTLTFKGGKAYAYAAVPPNVYKEFEDASSPGKYFLANIKNTYSVSPV